MFVFRFFWWGMRWSFATAFFLAVMGAAGLYVFNRSVEGGGYVVVPNIERMSLTEATYVLAERGLEIGPQIQSPSMNEQVPKYHVIAQRPAANTVVREGRKVYPTVSIGPEEKTAPSLLGKSLDDAQAELGKTSFTLGTVARVPDDKPRDTVIAQYPPLSQGVAADGLVHLLLSLGPSTQSFLMPDLVGMSLERVVSTLSTLNVTAIPIQVERQDVASDVVLEQTPEPGTLVTEGQKVYYKIKKSGVVSVEDVWREVTVSYVVPNSGVDSEVQIDVIDRTGLRATRFGPKLVSGGYKISFSVAFEYELRVECFINGQRERAIYYEGGKQPVETIYSNTQKESGDAADQDSAINTGV